MLSTSTGAERRQTAERLHALAIAFLCWWRDELWAAVPVSVRHWLSGHPRELLVRLSETHCSVLEAQGDCWRLAKEIDLDASSRDDLEGLLSLNADREIRPVVQLPPDRFLRRRLVFPRAVRENLNQVLAYEMDGFTPFRSDQVSFTSRILGTDASDSRHDSIEVEVTVARLDDVEHAASVSGRLGLQPVAVVADEPAPHRRVAANLLPRARRPRQLNAHVTTKLGLAAVAMILTLVLLIVPLFKKQSAIADLEARIEQLRPDANKASELREAVRGATLTQAYPSDLRQGRPRAVNVIRELTTLLPDHTWLRSLRLSNDQLEIEGESRNAGELVSLLDGSGIFEDVRFVSQVSIDTQSRSERFSLSMKLAGNWSDD
jgi:general secretion pathway protein L